jgi:hypothetical protein
LINKLNEIYAIIEFTIQYKGGNIWGREVPKAFLIAMAKVAA